jgi:hypothetical protein
MHTHDHRRERQIDTQKKHTDIWAHRHAPLSVRLDGLRRWWRVFFLCSILPVRKQILAGLLHCDLLGFHTYDYARVRGHASQGHRPSRFSNATLWRGGGPALFVLVHTHSELAANAHGGRLSGPLCRCGHISRRH